MQVQISRYQEIKTIHVQVDPYLDVLKVPGTHLSRPFRCTQYLENYEIIEIQTLYIMYLFMSVSFYMAHIYIQSDFYYFLQEISIATICVGNPLAVPLLGFVML